MKKLLFLFTLTFLMGCTPISKLYIPFGDAKLQHAQSKDAIVRLYFDRHGQLYPDIPIDDTLLQINSSLLTEYYHKNLKDYKAVCTELGVNGGDQPTEGIIEEIQNRLIQKKIGLINTNSTNKEIVFIIHGYNDHPLKKANDNTFVENKATEDAIIKKFPKRSFLFVEVYWDGLSKENGASFLTAVNSIRIWGNSQVSATYVGLELRRILAKINDARFSVVTHSHGAGVITNALFDVYKFDPDYYLDEGDFIPKAYSDKRYDTPKQDIHIGMLAPAIPGVNVFKDYSLRTVNGVEGRDEALKNYHFILGFNRYDPVTRKFYTKSSLLGSTTVACNYKELVRTSTKMNNDPNVFDFVDFSFTNANKKQYSHSWFVYLANEPHSGIFFEKVFK
jgi:hypothetical protein